MCEGSHPLRWLNQLSAMYISPWLHFLAQLIPSIEPLGIRPGRMHRWFLKSGIHFPLCLTETESEYSDCYITQVHGRKRFKFPLQALSLCILEWHRTVWKKNPLVRTYRSHDHQTLMEYWSPLQNISCSIDVNLIPHIFSICNKDFCHQEKSPTSN